MIGIYQAAKPRKRCATLRQARSSDRVSDE